MDIEQSFPSYKCKLNVLSRPDGSALFCQDETAVIAGIYGPVEVKMQKILIDKASVECHYKPKSGSSGVEDRLYESLIRNICEAALVASLYPRSAILVTLQEMQNNGQLISCAINAACLACLNSGIDMKCMFAAVTTFLTTDEELTMLPPINEKIIKGVFVFVFENNKSKILASHTEGSFTLEQYQEAINISREESLNIFSYYKNVLLENK